MVRMQDAYYMLTIFCCYRGLLVKLKLMLDLCYDFGYENDDLTFNAKNSAFLTFGVLFEKASGVDMFIGGERINWVTVCNYLGVNVCSGRKLCTSYEDRRQFCEQLTVL